MESDLPRSAGDPHHQEQVRRELASGPQDKDLPWPPPRGWKWHEMLLTIKKEIRTAQAARGRGDMLAQLSAQAALKRAERRYRRWKLICFWSGWRPWQDREAAGAQ